MKVIWAMVCESSSTDMETNNVSLFNVLEEMYLPEPPDEDKDGSTQLVPMSLHLVASFGRSEFDQEEQGKARIAFLFPGERERAVLPEFDVLLDPAHRHRIKFEIGGLPIKGEGEYRFQIQSLDETGNWDSIFEVPLLIFFQNEE